MSSQCNANLEWYADQWACLGMARLASGEKAALKAANCEDFGVARMLRLEGSVIRHLEPLQGKTIPCLLAAGPCLEGVIVVTEYIEGRYDTFSLHCQCKILLNSIGSPSPLSGRAHLLACYGLLAIQHGTARLAVVTYLLL